MALLGVVETKCGAGEEAGHWGCNFVECYLLASSSPCPALIFLHSMSQVPSCMATLFFLSSHRPIAAYSGDQTSVQVLILCIRGPKPTPPPSKCFSHVFATVAMIDRHRWGDSLSLCFIHWSVSVEGRVYR